MKKEDISDAIGGVKDEFVQQAGAAPAKKARAGLRRAIAAAIALLLTAGAVFGAVKLLPRPFDRADDGTAENVAEEPEPPAEDAALQPEGFALLQAQYPAALKNLDAARDGESVYGYSRADAAALDLAYVQKTAAAFLCGAGAENRAFSPADLFFQLGVLAEMSGGESRAQILSLLGFDELESLRKTARALWLSNYRNYDGDGSGNYEETEVRCIPATSFWLNGTVDLIGDAAIAENLRSNYYTSFYKGDPADPAYGEAFAAWISEQTQGLLDGANDFGFEEDTLFKSVSTLLYKACWTVRFPEKDTYTGVFHAPDGDREVSFLTEESEFLRAYEADSYTAFEKGLTFGSMWFILPDEGVTTDDLLQSGVYLEPISIERDPNAPGEAFSPPEPEYDMYRLKISVPKFDVSSTLKVPEALKTLGVTDLFDAEKAEIPMLRMQNAENVYLRDGEQDVRVTVDENGVAAASATIMEGAFGDPRFKDLTVTLDRPFLAVICGADSMPLFVIVVNAP